MAFWGVEVKPGNRYTHVYDQTRGRLRITQAVLGSPVGSNSNSKPSSRTVVQCNYDKSSPVLICCLLPGSNESTHMELEFEEQSEVVFSVLGQRSVHLTGYFLGRKKFGIGGEDSEETNGEDIADTESEGLGADEDDSYESDFIDDDDIIDDTPLLQSSEDDESWKRRAAKRKKRKVIIESEDEENEFLEDKKKRKEKKRKSDKQNGEYNKMNSDEQKGKNSKKKINKEEERGVSNSKKIDKKDKIANSVTESKENKMVECVGENKQPEKSTPEKKKSKIGKKETEKVDTKQPKIIETFPSGLIIEEISTSSPEGQIANPGCKVYVNYIGKLQNGKTFDSNAGQKPFKFHLGKGQVIMGWDLGINGMRVGEKRRLTIPPTLGYGDEEVENVPKNSWLDYEVEMVKVK